MHVMWFETEMALESLRSVKLAQKNTSLNVKIKLCFNCQTYYDTPINGDSKSMFDILLSDDYIKNCEIIWKTNEDPFYNVGDWRRECYDENNITVWGEADCLVPETYFYYIENIFSNDHIKYPYVLSIKQKKMWDDSWKPTEHETLQKLTLDEVRALDNCFVTGEGSLSLDKLNNFNNSFNDKHEVILSNYYKGDGALVCLSPQMPRPFIANDIHMCGEDTYFYNFIQIKKVPLYNISYYLKGHNTGHLKKRMNHIRTSEQIEAFKNLDSRMRLVANEELSKIYSQI